jgi:hypothetical protein
MPSQLVLLLEDDLMLPTLSRVVASSASGVPVIAGTDFNNVVNRTDETVKAAFVSAKFFDEAVLAMVQRWPHAKLIFLTEEITNGMVSTAIRQERVVGFVGWNHGSARQWELSFLTRRLLAPREAPPSSADLLTWGASSVTFRPRTNRDRDQAVQAVEVVAKRFGIQGRSARVAADAAHELLMNAMFDAPVDAEGKPVYAYDRTADIRLNDHEVPTLRLTIDAQLLALDMIDSFGRLGRTKIWEGILRGRTGQQGGGGDEVLDTSHGGAGLGLFNLSTSAAVMRMEVVPDKLTVVSWMQARGVSQRDQRSLAPSLYFISHSRMDD